MDPIPRRFLMNFFCPNCICRCQKEIIIGGSMNSLNLTSIIQRNTTVFHEALFWFYLLSFLFLVQQSGWRKRASPNWLTIIQESRKCWMASVTLFVHKLCWVWLGFISKLEIDKKKHSFQSRQCKCIARYFEVYSKDTVLKKSSY